MLGDKKLEKGDYYLSPEGYKVFTEQFHLKEGIVVKVVAVIAPLDLINPKKDIKFVINLLTIKKIK